MEWGGKQEDWVNVPPEQGSNGRQLIRCVKLGFALP